MEHYALIEPNPLAEHLARFDVFAREVYSRDPVAVPAGNKTRRSTKATSNVENMFICTEPELVEKVFGCLAPPIWNSRQGRSRHDGARRIAKRGEPSELTVRLPCGNDGDIRLCWHR